jgi:uncharacterized membrane protein YdjX (TVP38/TMEM64 family)
MVASNNRRIFQIILLIIFFVVGTKFAFSFKYYAYIDYYNQKIVYFIESFHPYDDLVFIIIQIFQVLIAGALPAEISGFVGGYLYGPVLGAIYSTIGLSIGSWLAFLLSRTFGLRLVRRLVRPSIMDKYDHFIEMRGPLVCFILFLIPGFPKAALCYIVGLSRMNIWTFMGVSTAGRLLGTILLSVSGDSFRALRIWVLVLIMALLAVFFLLAYIYRDRLLKMAGNKEM